MKTQFIIKHGALSHVGGGEEDLLGILGMDLSKAQEINDRLCPNCERELAIPSEDFFVKYRKIVKTENSTDETNNELLGYKDICEIYFLCLCGKIVKGIEHFSHYTPKKIREKE